MNKYTSGSQWRKWDLHIHSNASDGKLSPKEIIDIAAKEGIDVIALTDHHTVRNIDETKRIGKERGIAVISGIEFRTEYGDKSVHIIGLLPDEHNGITLTQDAIEHLILDKLDLSHVTIEAKGREKKKNIDDFTAFKKGMHQVQVDLKKAANLIHEYGGLVSVHAGKKSNSLEQMRHEGKGKSNVKDVVDSLGTVKEELLTNYIDICEIGSPNDKNAEFYTEKFNMPVITASDSHDRESLGKIYTWIKADPTFEGLRQIKYEPELRVRIQISKPEKKADYQVIEAIEIAQADFGNQRIPFNQNLNTIIGGRSSGKSILLGAIARLANYVGKIKDNDAYNDYIDTIIGSMKLIWKDHGETVARKVEYFPQTYINGLAAKSEKTIKLIESILKDSDERKQAFDDYESETTRISVNISTGVENLIKLQGKASELEEEILSIGDMGGIIAEIKKITKEIETTRKKSTIEFTDTDEKEYTRLKEEIRVLQESIESQKNVEKQLLKLKNENLLRDISGEFLGLPDDLKQDLSQKLINLSQYIDDEWKNYIDNIVSDGETSISKAINRIKEIETDKKFIDGETYYKENEALTELSNSLEAEKNKQKHISDLLNKKNEIEGEIAKQKRSIIQLQISYYDMAFRLGEKIKMEKDEICITPQILFSGEIFADYIDNSFSKRGNAIKEYLEYSYIDKEHFIETLRSLIEKIEKDELTIKGNKDKRQLMLNLLSPSYYKLAYNVEYQGDNLDSMSEGKKAFVILRLLLDFNDNKCPILIDQPEDDLDNRAIFNDLVTYIRNKKRERQIIIVTHNPNIVVAADAEEIIVANMHGIHNENRGGVKFEYCSGAMENTFRSNEGTILHRQGIREHICEILEGGDVAFLKRENKYCLRRENGR